MMNVMKIEEKYKVLTIGPWTLYDLKDRTFIFVLGEVEGTELIDKSQDNYLIMDGASQGIHSIGQAVIELLRIT